MNHVVIIRIIDRCHLLSPIELCLLRNHFCISDSVIATSCRPCFFDEFLEAVESDYDACYVIKGLLVYALVQNTVHRGATTSVHGHRLLEVLWLQSCFVDLVHDLLVVHFLIDTIAAYHDEVIVIFYLKSTDLWYGNYNIRVASISLILCLDVTDCSRDGKASWEYSVRPDQCLST